MPDLLLEVLSEEIPARMQAGGAAGARGGTSCPGLEEARFCLRGVRRVLRDASPPCRGGARPTGGAARTSRSSARARASMRPRRPSRASSSPRASLSIRLRAAGDAQGPGLVRGHAGERPPHRRPARRAVCRRRWPRSPGPSPCAGTRAACAGCVRSVPSSACWTMRSCPSASAPSRADGPLSATASSPPGRSPSQQMSSYEASLLKKAKVMLDWPDRRAKNRGRRRVSWRKGKLSNSLRITGC